MRYGTKTSSSTQRKGVRRIEVLEGPHTHERFKHGPVVVVKDLTDPQGPVEKTMYCDRFLTIDLERGISNRFDRQQAGARSLRWTSETLQRRASQPRVGSPSMMVSVPGTPQHVDDR